MSKDDEIRGEVDHIVKPLFQCPIHADYRSFHFIIRILKKISIMLDINQDNTQCFVQFVLIFNKKQQKIISYTAKLVYFKK